jgi:dihydroneopterin aldolase
MPDTLTLSRLRFFGHHGLLPEEKAHGQILEVTVRLELSLAAAGRADDLTLTADYRAVYATIRAVLEGPRCHLVETLAESAAAALLRDFPAVSAVDVEVTKPHPPVNFAFSGLTIHIRRTRSSS